MQQAKYNIGQVLFHVSNDTNEGGWSIGAVLITAVSLYQGKSYEYVVEPLDILDFDGLDNTLKNKGFISDEDDLFDDMGQAIRRVHKNIANGMGFPNALDDYRRTNGLTIDDLIKWEDERNEKNAKREEDLANIADTARSINHPEKKEGKQ